MAGKEAKIIAQLLLIPGVMVVEVVRSCIKLQDFIILISVSLHNKSRGAGSQCGYPNFCPTFVICLVFVQHRSSICLHFVLVKHLSKICPKNPTFVPSKSNICLSSQTFVLHLSSDLIKVNQKLEGQNLVII